MPRGAYKPFKRLRESPRTETNQKPNSNKPPASRGQRGHQQLPEVPPATPRPPELGETTAPGRVPTLPRQLLPGHGQRPTTRHREPVPARRPRRGPGEGRAQDRPPPRPSRPAAKAPPWPQRAGIEFRIPPSPSSSPCRRSRVRRIPATPWPPLPPPGRLRRDRGNPASAARMRKVRDGSGGTGVRMRLSGRRRHVRRRLRR